MTPSPVRIPHPKAQHCMGSPGQTMISLMLRHQKLAAALSMRSHQWRSPRCRALPSGTCRDVLKCWRCLQSLKWRWIVGYLTAEFISSYISEFCEAAMGLPRTKGCKKYIKSQAVYSFCRTFCPPKHSRPFVRIAEDGTVTWLALRSFVQRKTGTKIFGKPY